MLIPVVDTVTFNKYFKIITPPAIEPITVDEVKDFARIDGTDEDDMIEKYIIAARQACELYLGRALITQTIRMSLDEWNVKEIKLQRPPLIAVTSITTIDEDDVETTYSSDNYYVVTDSIPGKVVIKSGSTVPTNSVRCSSGFRITYTAGYGTAASDVPQAIRTSLKLWTTAIYETRDLTGDPAPDVKAMLSLYRVRNL